MARHKWSELVEKMSPESRARAERKADAIRAALELNELRQARQLTQEELAERLGTGQANVSKLERRLDMHVSTLREVIEAMGGELRLTAHFPDAEYRIDQFDRPAQVGAEGKDLADT